MDLYEELGVTKDAEPEEIKQAYRSQAKARHPDRGGEPGSFHRLQLAYDVLSDAERRAHYDATGQSAQQQATLGAALEAVVEAVMGGHPNPVEYVAAKAKKAIADNKKAAENYRAAAGKLRSAAERISCKGENLISAGLNNQAEKQEQSAEVCERANARFEAIIEFAKEYEYKEEEDLNQFFKMATTYKVKQVNVWDF